jgi:hypothetical protein
METECLCKGGVGCHCHRGQGPTWSVIALGTWGSKMQAEGFCGGGLGCDCQTG